MQKLQLTCLLSYLSGVLLRNNFEDKVNDLLSNDCTCLKFTFLMLR